MKNIKFTLFAILIMGFTLTVSADDGKGKKGIRAGFQTSNIYYNGSSLESNLNSFYVGFFKDTKIFPMLHFGTGLEYSQMGTFEDNDNKFVMHYLSIPLNLKLKIGPFYGLGGVAANFKVGEKWTIQGLEATSITKAKNFDVPVYAGLGFKVLMLQIEARYYWGTIDLYENTPTIDPYKTQYFQLGVGISF